MAQYWLQHEGRMYGPYSGGKLKTLAAAGQVQHDDHISADRQSWQIAVTIPGLFPAETGLPQTASVAGTTSAPYHGQISAPDQEHWFLPRLSRSVRVAVVIAGVIVTGLVLTALIVRNEGRSSGNLGGSHVTPVSGRQGVKGSTPNGEEAKKPAETRSDPSQSRTAKRTKEAWDRMNDIVASLALHSPTKVESPFWGENVRLHALINTDYIHQELRDHIQEWITTSRELYRVIEKYKRDADAIRDEVAQAERAGAQLGSLDKDNPRAGAAAGQLVVGAFARAAAAKKMEELNAAFRKRSGELLGRARNLYEERRALGRRLSQAYNLPFELRKADLFE